ncbi:hypothetical protein BKA80DRAFT_280804 [Phyllosticta citrichinensis]
MQPASQTTGPDAPRSFSCHASMHLSIIKAPVSVSHRGRGFVFPPSLSSQPASHHALRHFLIPTMFILPTYLQCPRSLRPQPSHLPTRPHVRLVPCIHCDCISFRLRRSSSPAHSRTHLFSHSFKSRSRSAATHTTRSPARSFSVSGLPGSPVS